MKARVASEASIASRAHAHARFLAPRSFFETSGPKKAGEKKKKKTNILPDTFSYVLRHSQDRSLSRSYPTCIFRRETARENFFLLTVFENDPTRRLGIFSLDALTRFLRVFRFALKYLSVKFALSVWRCDILRCFLTVRIVRSYVTSTWNVDKMTTTTTTKMTTTTTVTATRRRTDARTFADNISPADIDLVP